MSFVGCVDALADTRISGWAADDADFSRTVQVDVFVNSVLAATVPCDGFRADLRTAGIGDGCKAFSFGPGRYLKPGRNQLEIRFAGTEGLLPKGSGCWVRPHEGLSDFEASLLAMVEAYCDFTPQFDMCVIGHGAPDLERILRTAGVPFRRILHSAPPFQADLLLLWESGQELLIRNHWEQSGVVAFCCPESGLDGVRQSLQQCGAADIALESLPPADGASRIMAFGRIGERPAGLTPPSPLLAHIHVPKCAGTSIRVLSRTVTDPGT